MQNDIPLKRHAAIVVAAVGWFALIVQFVVSLRLGIDSGRGWPHGVWMFFAFFTVLTNLLVATTATLVAFAPASRHGRALGNPDALTGVAANIILVAITYNAILAGLWRPHGWQLVADLSLHDIVPILFVAFWWIAVPRGEVSFRRAAWWAIYPIVYFVYAMATGATTGFYAYPFINVTKLGYGWVVINALGVLFGFFVILGVLTTLKFSFRAAESRGRAA